MTCRSATSARASRIQRRGWRGRRCWRRCSARCWSAHRAAASRPRPTAAWSCSGRRTRGASWRASPPRSGRWRAGTSTCASMTSRWWSRRRRRPRTCRWRATCSRRRPSCRTRSWICRRPPRATCARRWSCCSRCPRGRWAGAICWRSRCTPRWRGASPTPTRRCSSLCVSSSGSCAARTPPIWARAISSTIGSAGTRGCVGWRWGRSYPAGAAAKTARSRWPAARCCPPRCRRARSRGRARSASSPAS